jgi:hypothetical protein
VRSSSGFLLLLVGSIALIGFLTGNLDRWLAYLFVPPGSSGSGQQTPTLTSAVTAGADRRGSGGQQVA